MDNAKAPQNTEISSLALTTIELGRVELGKATEETRGCLGVVNDFVCFMPLDGLSRA